MGGRQPKGAALVEPGQEEDCREKAKKMHASLFMIHALCLKFKKKKDEDARISILRATRTPRRLFLFLFFFFSFFLRRASVLRVARLDALPKPGICCISE